MRVLIVALLLCVPVLAQPRTRPAAVVKAGSGLLNAGLNTWEPIAAKAVVPDDSSLKLGTGGKLTLVFYKDGHTEELTGPCMIKIAGGRSEVVQGAAASLVRVTAGKRVSWLPAGAGNVQRPGGQVSPRYETVAMVGIGEAAVEVTVENGALRPKVPFLYEKATVRLLQEGRQLASWAAGAEPPPVTFEEGQRYALELEGPEVKERIEFRGLGSRELAVLAELLSNPYPQFDEALLQAAAYEKLGLPHLQAAAWQTALQQKPGDPGLLRSLYKLYKKMNRPEAARFLEERAGVPLRP